MYFSCSSLQQQDSEHPCCQYHAFWNLGRARLARSVDSILQLRGSEREHLAHPWSSSVIASWSCWLAVVQRLHYWCWFNLAREWRSVYAHWDSRRKAVEALRLQLRWRSVQRGHHHSELKVGWRGKSRCWNWLRLFASDSNQNHNPRICKLFSNDHRSCPNSFVQLRIPRSLYWKVKQPLDWHQAQLLMLSSKIKPSIRLSRFLSSQWFHHLRTRSLRFLCRLWHRR